MARAQEITGFSSSRGVSLNLDWCRPPSNPATQDPSASASRVSTTRHRLHHYPGPAGAAECDAQGGFPRADGVAPISSPFRDSGHKRQRRAFQVSSCDDAVAGGRRSKIGDQIEGGGNRGTLVDIQWQVYVANKKACWYEFDTTIGEHGYPPDHPRRNPDVDDARRSRLIIDPGPRIVNGTTKRRASFDRPVHTQFRLGAAVLDRHAWAS
jgi:hypothetical protein